MVISVKTWLDLGDFSSYDLTWILVGYLASSWMLEDVHIVVIWTFFQESLKCSHDTQKAILERARMKPKPRIFTLELLP